MHEKHLDAFVKIARKHIKTDAPTILEVGVLDCKETLAFKEHFPQSRIFSFECNPDALPVCRAKIAGMSGITLTEKALTDSIGEISFFKTVDKHDGSWNPGASSIFKANEDYPLEKYSQQEIKVPSSTLEAEMKRLSVDHADMLWTDIQGAELKMLKGAGAFLGKISLIHAEVEFFEQYHGQPLFSDILAYLNSQGFSLLTFTTMGKFAGDAVFINKALYQRKTPEGWTVAYHTAKERVTGKMRGLGIKIRRLADNARKPAAR